MRSELTEEEVRLISQDWVDHANPHEPCLVEWAERNRLVPEQECESCTGRLRGGTGMRILSDKEIEKACKVIFLPETPSEIRQLLKYKSVAKVQAELTKQEMIDEGWVKLAEDQTFPYSVTSYEDRLKRDGFRKVVLE